MGDVKIPKDVHRKLGVNDRYGSGDFIFQINTAWDTGNKYSKTYRRNIDQTDEVKSADICRSVLVVSNSIGIKKHCLRIYITHVSRLQNPPPLAGNAVYTL